MDLTGRRVLITGASRGIGQAIAEKCGAAGARLALVARSADALQKVADPYPEARCYPADLADPGAVADLIERVEADGGPVDVLVNNAGVDMGGAFVTMAPEDIEQIYRVNLLTPVHLCHQVLPGMLARGQGHIVNVSSLAGCAAFPGMVAYASTKAGLSQFTSVLRADLKGLPVGTTLVEIGFVPTDMYEHVRDYQPALLSKQRLDRIGIITDVPVTQVAQAVVEAITKGRRHVRLPKRAAINALLPETPRRVVELLLSGVPHQA